MALINNMSMEMTIGGLREDLDQGDERRRRLDEGMRRVKTITGEDCKDVVIQTAAIMGQAAGRCFTADGKVENRQDVVLGALESANGVDHFVHVNAHEMIHRDGVHNEGLTELEASEAANTNPVDSLRDQVRHARALREVVGDDIHEMAREEDAAAQILLAYAIERTHQGVDATVALEEGQKHWNKSFDYAA